MTFLARAERTIDSPRDVLFDRLAAYDSWRDWMPASFRPVGVASGVLLRGGALRVAIEGMPVPAHLVVSVLRRPEEIAWRGGIRGVLWAEHRFVFGVTTDGVTRVESLETWHGPLARLLRGFILPRAERIGAEQLEALARGPAAR